jgi:hypothetical protein
MVDLSLGQVAGVIAAGIFVGKYIKTTVQLMLTVLVSILFQLLLPLILVGLLNLNESAVTWYAYRTCCWLRARYFELIKESTGQELHEPFLPRSGLQSFRRILRPMMGSGYKFVS